MGSLNNRNSFAKYTIMKIILVSFLAVALLSNYASAQTLSDTFVDGGLEVKYFIDFHADQGPSVPIDYDVRLINDSPRGLSLLGDFTVKGGFELGDSLVERSTPFVDFHYGANRGVEDFNVRLINDSDHWLAIRGGNLVVDGLIKTTSLELTSDRNAKDAFAPANSNEILTKLSNLPISTWHYTNSPAARHLGPTAQDFKSAFDLGASDTQISVVDGIGVALAAIQALTAELKAKDVEISSLRGDLADMRKVVAALHEGFDVKDRNPGNDVSAPQNKPELLTPNSKRP
jgi:hypothetical protein